MISPKGCACNYITCVLHLCILACALSPAHRRVRLHSPVISIDFSRRSLSLISVSLSQHTSPPSSFSSFHCSLSCVQIAIILLSWSWSLWGPALLQCKRWQSLIGASGRLLCPPPPSEVSHCHWESSVSYEHASTPSN